MKNRIMNLVILFMVSGMFYLTIECFWRGYTNLPSFFMGGLSGVLIGKLNHFPKYYKLKVWQECFIGMILIVLIELVFGLTSLHLNVRFWDYSDNFMNYKGVICLPYAIIWCLITPFCMWIEDISKWKLFNEGKYYSIFENYKELLTGK